MASATKPSGKEHVQYIPHPDRQFPKTVSVTDGNGKRHVAVLHPRKWTSVPTCVADMLYSKRKRMSAPVEVPDGEKLEKRMNTGDPGVTTEVTYAKYDIIFKERD